MARLLISIAATAWAVCGAAAWADTGRVLGTWLADEGKSHVQIYMCGDKLCGKVTWLKEPLDPAGKPQTDVHNSDASLRTRPIMGLDILKGFVQDDSGPGQWEDGTIYDPDDGKTYQCTLALQDPNTLRVHGYVGIAMFGKTQLWTRVQ